MSIRNFLNVRPISTIEPRNKALLAYIWTGRPQERPSLSAPMRQMIRSEFDHRCALCSTRQSGLQIHHIVPWREALLLFNGEVNHPSNLIPLCSARCHREADEEVVSRPVVQAIKANGVSLSRMHSNLVGRSDIAIEFHGAIARGNHRQLRDALRSDALKATEVETRKQKLLYAASAARRNGSKGVKESIRLLDEASSISQRNDNEAHALIAYERGKIGILRQEFPMAKGHFNESLNRAESEVAARMAIHSSMAATLREEAAGEPAPEVSLLPECGLIRFQQYANGMISDALGYRWCVFTLLDSGEYFARIGAWSDAIEMLAQAEDLINKQSLRAFRANLYRNLAVAFKVRGDWWRSMLAASIALALHREYGLTEHKGTHS